MIHQLHQVCATSACVCSLLICCIGVYLVFCQITNDPQWVFDKLHWVMNGLVLFATSFVTAVYCFWTHVLEKPIDDETYSGSFVRKIVLNFGIITSDMGRASYFLIVGIYIYPLLNILRVNAPDSARVMISVGNLTGIFCIIIALSMYFIEACFLCIDRKQPQSSTASCNDPPSRSGGRL